MSMQKTLVERRTIHDYTRDKVSEAWIEEALDAAIHAPNHKNTAPWKFYWLGREARQPLVELSVKLRRDKEGKDLPPGLVQAIENKILDPDVLMVVTRKNTDNAFQAREDYAAIACAIHNLSLSLWDKGVGTKWSTGEITRHAETYRNLSIHPQSETIEGFIWIGVPQRIPPKPPKVNWKDCTTKLP